MGQPSAGSHREIEVCGKSKEPDRKKSGAALLVEHARNPRHKRGAYRKDADVAIPGGGPECGGSVVVYLKGDGNGKIEGLSWTGQGDTISMGAASIWSSASWARASGWKRFSSWTTKSSSSPG